MTPKPVRHPVAAGFFEEAPLPPPPKGKFFVNVLIFAIKINHIGLNIGLWGGGGGIG